MPLLKRIDETKTQGPNLEKASFVAVMDNDAKELESQLQEILSRTNGNAIVAILPIFEGMPSLTVKRKKKGSDEEVASAVLYSSRKAVTLPFGFSENNLRGRFILDEKLTADDEEDDDDSTT